MTTTTQQPVARPRKSIPDTLVAGPETTLTSLHAVATSLNMSISAVTRLCVDLHVPTIAIGRGRYVNLRCLDFALFCLTVPGASDYTAPGSVNKSRYTPTSVASSTAALASLKDPKHLDRCLSLYTVLTRSRAVAATEARKRLFSRRTNPGAPA